MRTTLFRFTFLSFFLLPFSTAQGEEPKGNGYYEILGVAKNATQEQIRAAYKELAREHHPDKRPGDPEAESRFSRYTEAYDVLYDPEKRERYDKGEKQAKPRTSSPIDVLKTSFLKTLGIHKDHEKMPLKALAETMENRFKEALALNQNVEELVTVFSEVTEIYIGKFVPAIRRGENLGQTDFVKSMAKQDSTYRNRLQKPSLRLSTILIGAEKYYTVAEKIAAWTFAQLRDGLDKPEASEFMKAVVVRFEKDFGVTRFNLFYNVWNGIAFVQNAFKPDRKVDGFEFAFPHEQRAMIRMLSSTIATLPNNDLERHLMQWSDLAATITSRGMYVQTVGERRVNSEVAEAFVEEFVTAFKQQPAMVAQVKMILNPPAKSRAEVLTGILKSWFTRKKSEPELTSLTAQTSLDCGNVAVANVVAMIQTKVISL